MKLCHAWCITLPFYLGCVAQASADSDGRGFTKAAGSGSFACLGSRVWGLGLGFRVWGLGFRVWGLGFRV